MVSIQRLHLEHDSGKSLHTAPDMSLVDLNRCGNASHDTHTSLPPISPSLYLTSRSSMLGTGLMEIVTRPDMSSGAEAALFVRQLIEILTSLDVSDGKLAGEDAVLYRQNVTYDVIFLIVEGSLRVDANVSVHKQGFDGPRCEIKNINGLRFLSKAIGMTQ